MKWEKVHQARERKIKQLAIKLVDGVEITHIIEEKNSVQVAVLEEQLN